MLLVSVCTRKRVGVAKLGGSCGGFGGAVLGCDCGGCWEGFVLRWPEYICLSLFLPFARGV